jgi:hypothetical protein
LLRRLWLLAMTVEASLGHDAIAQNRIMVSCLRLSMIVSETGFHFSGS